MDIKSTDKKMSSVPNDLGSNKLGPDAKLAYSEALSDRLRTFAKVDHTLAPAEQVQDRQSHKESSLELYCEAVKQVIPIMHEQYGEPFSLQEMAETVSLSPHHFNRVFRKVTGVTPARFLSALRLRAAVHLLLTTELSVTDICFEVGYNSLGTFTSRFAKLVGLPPTQLRELAQSATPILERLSAHCDWLGRKAERKPSVSGTVDVNEPTAGWIFVGLFQTSVPQGCPVGCTLLLEPGKYAIGPVADGRYHVFAAGFPRCTDPLSFLIPDFRTLKVGSSQGALVVRRGRSSSPAQITMRRMRITDPPIVTAMPLLMVEKVRNMEEAQQK